jgi:hypothetical protein
MTPVDGVLSGNNTPLSLNGFTISTPFSASGSTGFSDTFSTGVADYVAKMTSTRNTNLKKISID